MSSVKDIRSIGVDEIGNRLREHLQAADTGRATALIELSGLQRAKQAVRRRERKRLILRYDNEDIRVERLERKLAVGDDLIATAGMEVDRLNSTKCEVREGEWVLRGHVRGVDAQAVAGMVVALSDDPIHVGQPVEQVRTGKSGEFEFHLLNSQGGPVAKALSVYEKLAQAVGGTKTRKSGVMQLWLHILNSDGISIFVDPQPMWVIPNVLDYRNEQLDIADEDVENVGPSRFLANANTLELHDLSKARPQCRIARIHMAYRKPFDSRNAAEDQGYDLCAYCFGKEKSKR